MLSLSQDDSYLAATNEQNLYIAFEEHQVAVYSNVAEVLTRIRRNFGQMLALEPKNIIGQLQVSRKNGEYYLLGGSEGNTRNSTLDDVLCSVKYEAIVALIKARPDLLWLHAGAAADQGSAIVISGCSGRGKSTLVTSLCTRGWSYLSDDVLPLNLNSGKVIPFPRTPEVRENIGRELPPEQIQQLKQIEFKLKPEAVCKQAMPIKALVFPTYSLHSPTQILPYSPATAALELLQNCINFTDHKQIAVRHVCELVKHLPTFRLFYSDSNLAAETIIDALDNVSCLTL